MKSSAYNYISTQEDGSSLLFNFYTLNLLVLDQHESKLVHELLKAPDTDSKSSKTRNMLALLKDKGFILDKNVDEFELLKWRHYGGYNQKKNLTLTILPSLACNFKCKYCYQEEGRQKMPENIRKALIGFVKSRVCPGGSFSVIWFGGEPLLFADVIERLSEAFISICRGNGVKYSASIITNGYLLDARNTEMLIRNQVKSAQITLDGPPDVHDSRRPLKGRKKTFRHILNNIKEASEKINISVRMNVDQQNRGSISELLDLLVQNGLERKIAFYLGQTAPYTEICNDVSGYCLTDEDFSLLGMETQMEMIKKGFSSSFRNPEAKDNCCMADCGNSFCITPSGGIFNCWNNVSDPEWEIGHLLEPLNQKMSDNMSEWLSRDPFQRKECSECQLLPMCMGGCPYLYGLTGRPNCHGWKHHPEESLLFYYYNRKLQQENEIAGKFNKAVESVKELKLLVDTKANTPE